MTFHSSMLRGVHQIVFGCQVVKFFVDMCGYYFVNCVEEADGSVVAAKVWVF